MCNRIPTFNDELISLNNTLHNTINMTNFILFLITIIWFFNGTLRIKEMIKLNINMKISIYILFIKNIDMLYIKKNISIKKLINIYQIFQVYIFH